MHKLFQFIPTSKKCFGVGLGGDEYSFVLTSGIEVSCLCESDSDELPGLKDPVYLQRISHDKEGLVGDDTIVGCFYGVQFQDC